MSYKVTAAYVTLRVPNELGQEVLLGFYEGAVVPEHVNQDDLDRHLRKSMVAEEGTPEADAASPVGRPVNFDDAGMPVSPQPPAGDQGGRDGRPSVRASKDDWVTYAASQRAEGVSEDDARAEAEGKSKAELVAKFGGRPDESQG